MLSTIDIIQDDLSVVTIYYSKELGYWRVKFDERDVELVRFAPFYPCNDIFLEEGRYQKIKQLLFPYFFALNPFKKMITMENVWWEPICR